MRSLVVEGRGGPAEYEALVTVVRDLVALLPVRTDEIQAGHEHPRLARDVRAHVPGVSRWEQRGLRQLLDVRHPGVLGLRHRLDRPGAAVAQVADDPGD